MGREYKDSGIEWIGQIPKEWNINKIGNLYQVRNEKVSDRAFPPLSVTMNGVVPQLETAAKTNNGDVRKLVRKGDFAINSRSDRRGSCGVSDYDGSVSLINTILIPRTYMNSQYYNWLFHTTLFADEFYKWGHGIVDDLWSTRWQEMKNISIVYPPLTEQQKIADYLDKVCGEVDEMIALQEKMIEELKAYKQSVITEAVTKGLNPNVPMKDSGIDWIGKIPKHWIIIPIKYIKSKDKNSFVDGPFGSNLKSEHFIENGDVLVVESGFITTGKFIYKEFKTISKEHFETIKRSECKGNDIIIAKIGANYGMAGELPLLSKPSVVSGNSLKITLDNTKMLNSIFVYLMMSSKWNYGFKGLVQENAQPALSLSGLNNFRMPLPPLPEQLQIASYLDSKCSDIDSLITIKQQKIEELKEYKKSVIYEYVTGKKEVV
jgi:type I restriction enzyme S subunit